MFNLVLRRARAEDLSSIIQLILNDVFDSSGEVTRDTGGHGYTTAFKAIDGDPNQFLIVAEEAREIVGTLQLTFIPGLARDGAWRGQIEAVRVASSQRSRGIGQKMVEWAILECGRRRCSHVQLTTDKRRIDAHRFYERLGFVASHIGYKLTINRDPS